jgi:hypothetical protein
MRDLNNQRFGKLTALYPTDKRQTNHVIWHCRCDCGNEKDVAAPRLTMGLATCCGCETSRLHDLTGRRFGRLLVIDRAENVYYPLVCLCGDGGAGKDRRVVIAVVE